LKKVLLVIFGVVGLTTIGFAGVMSAEARAMSFILKLAGYSVLGIILISLLYSSIFIVRQKTAEIVETFGKFSSVRNSGLNFKLPWPISAVAGRINLQIRELRATIGSRTKDESFLDLPIATQFRVIGDDNDTIKKAFYELEDPEEQLNSYINNIARSAINTMTVSELYSNKNQLEKDIKDELNSEFSKFGYEIVNVLIDDPILAQELITASNRVLAAEKEKFAAMNEAEALKIKLVGEAEAEKSSLKLKAEAFSSYRAITAQGNIEAMQVMLGKKITNADGKLVDNPEYEPISFDEKDVLDFFLHVDTNEAIRSASKSGATVVVSTPQTKSDNQTVAMIEAMNKVSKSK